MAVEDVESVEAEPEVKDDLLGEGFKFDKLELPDDIESLQPEFDDISDEEYLDGYVFNDPKNIKKKKKVLDKEASEDLMSLEGWSLDDKQENVKSVASSENDKPELNLKKLTKQLNAPVDKNVKIITIDPNLNFSSK